MSFKFGKKSLERLETCHGDLQELGHAVMQKQLMDFACEEGYRSPERHAELVKDPRGVTKVKTSKHSMVPSEAVHFVPYPIDWGHDPETRTKAIGRFYLLAGIVLATAEEIGVKVRWGGDWDMDGDIMDQKFDDLAHFERRKT